MQTYPRALPQTLDYIEGEAPASFLSRLAMENGSNLSEFASVLGIKLADVIDGAPATTAWLAQMGGVTPDQIAKATFRRTGTRSFVRGGVNRPGFTGGQNSRRIARYGTDIKGEDFEAVFA